MLRHLLSDRKGSIAPVGVTLLATVVILAAVILEREWINYQLALAQQTADFAAEAAGHMHEAYATINVDYYQYWYDYVPVCLTFDDQGNCIPTLWPVLRTETQTRQFTAREKDLIGNGWREVAGCSDSALSPNWLCTHVEELDSPAPTVVFNQQTESVGRTVFLRNWKNTAAARVVDDDRVSVTAQGGQGKVIVTAEIELRPLFGLAAWTERVQVHGAAVTKPTPLKFG